jgi:hypothetical protein
MGATPWRGLSRTLNLKADFWAGSLHTLSHATTLSIPEKRLFSDFLLAVRQLSRFLDLFAHPKVQVFRNLQIRNRLSPSHFSAALDSKLRPGFFYSSDASPWLLREASI